MSANALAVALRVPASKINEIVRERRAVTPDTTMGLARYFGGDALSWPNILSCYDLKVSEPRLRDKTFGEVHQWLVA